jgi:hypothetical protein
MDPIKRSQQSKSTESVVLRIGSGSFLGSSIDFIKSSMVVVALGAALAPSTAWSQTLETTFDLLSPGQNVTGTWDNGVTVNNYPAGELQFSKFDAFCAEPGILIGTGPLIYTIQSPSSLANYDTISRLVGGYLASSQTNQEAAGFQWAIWEVIAEISLPWNLFDGNVNISPVSASTANLANSYLSNVSSFSPAEIVYLTSSTSQDIVAWNVIPEPSSFALVVLSGAFLMRRRRA